MIFKKTDHDIKVLTSVDVEGIDLAINSLVPWWGVKWSIYLSIYQSYIYIYILHIDR